MSISLYDLLDVDSDASADEIRAAWRSAVADLDPTDRRFAVYSEAGSVLLDPERRAAYDAERAAEETSATDEVEPAAQAATAEEIDVSDGAGAGGAGSRAATAAAATSAAAGGVAPGKEEGLTRAERRIAKQARRKAQRDASATDAAHTADEPGEGSGRRLPRLSARAVPAWLLAVLGVVLVALVAVSVYLVVAVPSDEDITEASREAQGAAERAIVPVLSYDHRSLEADGEAAREWMTEDYQEKYDQLFAQIEETAPETKTVVRTEVVASGLVRSGEERVQVLVFVDRPTRNKSLEEPVVYKDQVRVTMEKVGDRWLVDQLCTTANCES